MENATDSQNHGCIFIDGVDINSIGLNYVRRSVSVIPQESYIFDGTLKFNVDPMDQFCEEEIISFLEKFSIYKYLIPKTDISKEDENLEREEDQILIEQNIETKNFESVILFIVLCFKAIVKFKNSKIYSHDKKYS